MVERNIGECEFQIEDGLAQIDMLDAEIRAWEFVDREGALAQARQLDQSTARGPLYGISVGMPATSMMSLTPTEMPYSGPRAVD